MPRQRNLFTRIIFSLGIILLVQLLTVLLIIVFEGRHLTAKDLHYLGSVMALFILQWYILVFIFFIFLFLISKYFIKWKISRWIFTIVAIIFYILYFLFTMGGNFWNIGDIIELKCNIKMWLTSERIDWFFNEGALLSILYFYSSLIKNWTLIESKQ